MPWHIPEDLKHFAETTKGSPVIMGRKTWESLPEKYRPLPGRFNAVVSSDPDFFMRGEHKNALAYSSFRDAHTMVRVAVGMGIAGDGDQIFVIGGASIYQQALPYADEIIATQVAGTYECDTFFPALNEKEWQITDRNKLSDRADVITYTRINNPKNIWI